jgi:hypothetical protein
MRDLAVNRESVRFASSFRSSSLFLSSFFTLPIFASPIPVNYFRYSKDLSYAFVNITIDLPVR